MPNLTDEKSLDIVLDVKVKVTDDAGVPSLREAAAILTTTLGLTRSIATVSAPPVPAFSAASV